MTPFTLESKPVREGWSSAVSEETVYGIVSRYHLLSGNLSSRITNFELTDSACAHLSVPFPNDLPKILNRLDLSVNSIKDFIERHTLLPYFQPFLLPDHYEKVLENFARGTGRGIKSSLGVLSCGIGGKDKLRFCPQCGKEDTADFGISTWYRAHQLPGVLVCPYHGILLNVSVHYLQDKNNDHLILPGASKFSENESFEVDSRTHEKALLFARLSTQILSMRNVENGSVLLRNRYLLLTNQKGFSGMIRCYRKKELISEFLDFWSDLKQVEPFDTILAHCKKPDSWLSRIFSHPQSSIHPMKHALFIGFIAGDIASLFGSSDKDLIRSVGKGKTENIREDGKQINSIFNDGMSPSELTNAAVVSKNVTRYKASRLGIHASRKARKITDERLIQVRTALGAGEPIVNIMQISRLSMTSVYAILSCDPALELQRLSALHDQRRKISRKKLMVAIEKYSLKDFWSIKNVDSVSKDVSWLSKWDKEWLAEVIKLVGYKKNPGSAVDWVARDQILLKEIELAKLAILKVSTPFVRVSKKEIARRITHGSWVLVNLKRMPESKNLISQLVENNENFKMRRLLQV